MIQDRINKVLPHLRAFAYDENYMYVRFTVMLPGHWDYDIFVKEGIIRNVVSRNESAILLIIGIDTTCDLSESPILNDESFDYFIDKIEEVIIFNGEKEKKEKILQDKIGELQRLVYSSTLSEVENLKIVKDKFIPSSITPEEIPYEPVELKIETGVPEVPYDINVYQREPIEDGQGEAIDLDSIPFVENTDEEFDINLPNIVQQIKRDIESQ